MAQIPHGPEHLQCPLHKKAMSLVCHKCPLWTLLRGKHPQTGDDVDEWNCALAMLPVLLVENAKQGRSGAAAVESLRNEIIKRAAPTMRLMSSSPIAIEGTR